MDLSNRTARNATRRRPALPALIGNAAQVLRAGKQYALFQGNPLHPSLRLKAVGPFWSVRVSGSYRALAIRKGDVFHWIWIGPHDEYEEILKHA